MSERFEIRQAQKRDEPAIRSCAENAYDQYVAAIGKKPAPMVADFRSLIASGHAYVAVDAGADVVGFIIFYQEGDHILLENVAVRSDATGRGIGKRLIKFCETEAKRSKATSVKLYTNEKMTENLSIYPHLGYQEIERRREDGFNRVFFEKPI